MTQVQDLQQQVETQKEALSNAKQKLQSVKSLKQKLNKAFEMFESIKEELEGVNLDKEIEAL